MGSWTSRSISVVTLFLATQGISHALKRSGVSGMTEFKGKKLTDKTIMGAYLVLAFIICVVFASLGSYGWLSGEVPHTTARERLFGYHPLSVLLGEIMLAYQLYNIGMCILIKEYRNAAFLGHHICTGSLALMVLHPFCHHYALYFFGIAEWSSAVLSIVDAAKYLPEFKQNFPALCRLSRLAFAVLFFILRTMFWPYLSYHAWSDCLPYLMGNSGPHDQATTRELCMMTFLLFANTGLTLLQWYWATLIIKSLTKSRPKKTT